MGSRLKLEGKIFGELRVIKSIGKRGKYSLWECLCSCGNTVEVIGANLTSHNTKSCGCFRNTAKITAFIDTDINIWDKFGFLTVTDSAEREKDDRGYLLEWCECACGNPQPKFYRRTSLLQGRITSCGECQQYTPPILQIVMENEDIELDKITKYATKEKYDCIVDKQGKVLWTHPRHTYPLFQTPPHYQLKLYDHVKIVMMNDIGTITEVKPPCVVVAATNGTFKQYMPGELILLHRP